MCNLKYQKMHTIKRTNKYFRNTERNIQIKKNYLINVEIQRELNVCLHIKIADITVKCAKIKVVV